MRREDIEWHPNDTFVSTCIGDYTLTVYYYLVNILAPSLHPQITLFKHRETKSKNLSVLKYGVER